MDIKDIQTSNLDYALLILSTGNYVTCKYFFERPDIKLRYLSSLTPEQRQKEGILAYMLLHFDVVWTLESSLCPDQSCYMALDDYVTKHLNQGYNKYSSNNEGDK